MKNLRNESLYVPFVQWFVHLLVIFVCYGQTVPGINESHYLTKAKHHWDASFAPGDLFLESHDSHFVAAAVAGLMARVASLSTVAWLGRLASWSLFAWAWIGLCRAVRLPRLLTPLALASWYFAVEYGHWAGEWAIGGFEAKAIAYPFVLKGVEATLNRQWRFVWPWMGLAMAWHPIVGGWAGVTVGLMWLADCWRRWRNGDWSSVTSQLPWLALGALIGLIGAVPALQGIGGPDRLGPVVASQVQVYYRLAHHMCPRRFAEERHLAAIASVLLLGGATLFWRYLHRQPPGAPQTRAEKRLQPDQQDAPKQVGRLLGIAWMSVAISLFGLVLDLGLATYYPNLASKLLRFYWFRWSDVAVPLAWTVAFWWGAAQLAAGCQSQKKLAEVVGNWLLAIGVLVVSAFGFQRVQSNWSEEVPPADKLVVESTGPHSIETNRYIDWLAACEWIRRNTPSDSLFLTPMYQQSFKWYAQRAEVVCWKDAPQDSASILEWYERVQACRPPRTPSGELAEWSTAEILALQRDYRFAWVLVDRTIQRTPLDFEIVYPIGIPNPSFAVFRIRQPVRDSAAESPAIPKS